MLSSPAARPLVLQPDKPYSWWFSGEMVAFKPSEGTLPAGLKLLEGRIFNVSDKLLETVQISRETLESSGWAWKAKEDGFYDIEFSWRDDAGNRTDVIETFWKQAPNGTKARFDRKKFSVAVTKRLDPNVKHVGQFGFHYHLNPKEIPLAQLVGYDFAFVHSIPWGTYYTFTDRAIEPERGVYNWDYLDSKLQPLTDAGFEIAAQFLYTPVWASPHPERSKEILVCLPASSAFAPKDLNDFTTFVEKTVERYKDRIKIWEIWNEPAMPGGSIYWLDTPENYVRMLKAGYETVKRVDPRAEVWNGGIGMRSAYYAFYDKMLNLGATPYFDKLSLHGVSTDIAPYRRIETENKAPHKEAVMTEWHAILVGNMSNKLMDSEAGLSMRMMRDQFIQIKQGITKTVIFEMSNQNEKETTNFAIANNWFTHSSGLFRLTPRLEPRHPAVVMATFLRETNKQAAFTKEVLVGKEGYGLLMATGKGSVLAVWSETEPVTVNDIKAFTNARSVLRDWEGKDLSLDGAAVLAPKQIYYLSLPDDVALAKAAAVERLIPSTRIQRASQSAPKAFFTLGKLPSDILPDGPWVAKDWNYVSMMSQTKRSDSFAARAMVGMYEGGVDVVVEVKDAKHVQEQKDSWWRGDSLQLGIDCEGRGMFGGNMELIAALKPDGVFFWKISVANAGADLPAGVSLANEPIRNGDCKITREGETTVYRIRLPWSELYPMAYDPNRDLKISLLVNNNDGQGRAGFLEWGGGIGGSEKDPSQYGVLKPSVKN
ncbi:MAG: hypothetical protein WC661_16240 [Opitutaceae bacterium]